MLLAEQGDHARARANEERALAIFEKLLGPEHALTLRAREELAGLNFV